MKKMGKFISMLALSAMIFAQSSTYVYALDAPAAESSTVMSYSVGERAGSFTVTDTYDFASFDAKVYVFSHDGTGAHAVFIQNDDPNKYFMLEFDTKTENNKGTAHVLEHSIMSGSAKYPSRSLAGALRTRSYLTYMNAFTKNASTSFPVASLSEKQLLKMAEYYTDLCFDPMILRDEDIFRSEAWRFTVDETTGKLGVNGTIYSEMNGRYQSDMEAMAKAVGLLYPGCPSSYIAGGIPKDILTLSYDEVKDFYRKYYKPSDCVAYLYGDIKDAKAFLDILDARFSSYARPAGTEGAPEKDASEDVKTQKDATGKDATKKDGPAVAASKGYAEKKYDFPAAETGSTTYRTDMVYAIDLGALPDERLAEIYAFIRCCDRDHSMPKLQLGSMFPGSSFGFGIIPDGGNIILTVSADGMSEDDASMFRAAVLGIFKDMAVNGLRENELGYFKSRMETDSALLREGAQAAADLLTSTVNYASNGRDLLTYMKVRDSLRDMSWFDNDLVKSIAAYLTMPGRSAMAVVTPRAGLLEQEAAQQEEALEKYASSMSDEEKKTIADEEKRIVKAASDDPSKYLAGLNVTGISDLTDDIRKYETSDTVAESGMRRVGVYSSTDGVYVTKLCLDASAVPQDMLGYLSLYVDLVNGRFVPTGKYRQDELSDMMNGYNIRGQDISLTVSSFGNDYIPYVIVQFMSSPQMSAGSFDLAYERLFDSIFDDPVKIREGITSIRQVVGDNIASNPENIARYIAYSSDAEGAAYYENTHYLEYYDFLGKIEKNIGGDYRNICAKLKEVGELINNTQGSVIGYVLPKDAEGDYLKSAGEFEKRLRKAEKKVSRYSFEKYGGPLGMVTSHTVVSNVEALGDISKCGIKEDDATLALALSLMTERYLRPQTRDRYGAYTCSYMEEYPVVSVYTARDPMIKETYDAFADMKEAWSGIGKTITQKELDEYITRMYSQEMQSSGDISDATKVMSDIIAGRGADRKSQRCAQLKGATVAGLAKYDELFEKLADGGRKVTAGSAQLIEKHKDQFTKVIDPFAN